MSERPEQFAFLIVEADLFAVAVFDRQRVPLVQRDDHISLGVDKTVKTCLGSFVGDHAGIVVERREAVLQQARVDDDPITLVVIVNDVLLGGVLHLNDKHVHDALGRRPDHRIIARAVEKVRAALAALDHIILLIAVNVDIARRVRRINRHDLRIDLLHINAHAVDRRIGFKLSVIALGDVTDTFRKIAVEYAAVFERIFKCRAQEESDRRIGGILIDRELGFLIVVEGHEHGRLAVLERDVGELLNVLADDDDVILKMIKAVGFLDVADQVLTLADVIDKHICRRTAVNFIVALAAEQRRIRIACPKHRTALARANDDIERGV